MSESGEANVIEAKEARVRIAGGDAAVLDIRPDEEWTTVGNIPGSVQASPDDALDAAGAISDEQAIVVVCTDGERSAEVAERLREQGRDAVSIDGGMEAWADDKLPLQPSEDPALPDEPGSVEDEGAAPAG